MYFYAFGDFRITFDGRYKTTKDQKTQFTGNWHFSDWYTWDDAKNVHLLGVEIKDSYANLVEERGWAKSFEEKGTWENGMVEFDCCDIAQPQNSGNR